MSEELKFEFNDYVIAIDEPYENDYGYVAIGKKQSNGINIVFKSPNKGTVNWFIELQKYITDLQSQLAESKKEIKEYIAVRNDKIKVVNKQTEKINQLKQQLEEKDEQIKKRVMVYEKQFIEQTDEIYSLRRQLAEKQNMIDEINKEFVQAVHDWKTLCAEKDKEIEDLKKWKEWYSIWHENFKKQIEDLTTELETYRPTKLHGNGQCKCFNCNAINWTDWCSQYKGHIYCNKCLKDILKEEQTPQIQLAIQELEKVKELVKDKSAWQSPFGLLKMQESDVEQIIDQKIKELKGE